MKNFFCKIKGFFKGKNKILIIAMIIVILILLAPIQKVEIGQQGILYNELSGNSSSNISSGLHIVIPFFQNLTSYPVNDRAYKIYRDNKSWNNGVDASIATPTNDNQKVSIDATFIYVLDKEKLNYIYERFNGQEIAQIEKGFLDDIFKASVISAVTQYSAYDVYSTKRGEIQAKIFEDLSEKLANTGIILKDMYIDTVRLSPEAESIIKARALAEAARIEAQGKADANKLISESLTDKIMTYEALQKMSESLRLMIVPSGSDTQLDFTKIIEQLLNEAENSAK
jgi:regulator of protease activity HflC (stomatin/prohibitin superfamily)